MATLRKDSDDRGRPALPGSRGQGGVQTRPGQRGAEAPLIDLLGELRSLHTLRLRGQLDDTAYEQRRGEVLRRI